jgi:hypothetical protein
MVVVMACGDDDFDGTLHDDGELGGRCYPNDTCNVGLSCSAGVCVLIDAPGGAPTDAPADAFFACNDDAALEPNNAIQTAFQTPVATTKSTLMLAGLAICPAGDADVYAVTITTANTNLEVIVDYAAGGVPLQARIINANSVTLANATPVTTTPRRIRAYAPTLPTGSYYAVISASPSGLNNYALTLNVTGP